MRIWTLHPKYLDAKGLVALWREALLAQKALSGQTSGYRAHPQLIRFRAQSDPVAYIASYLLGVHEESLRRGYHFDSAKIAPKGRLQPMPETEGQLLYEWEHLKAKLLTRSPQMLDSMNFMSAPEPHPLFTIVPGPIQDWERAGKTVQPYRK